MMEVFGNKFSIQAKSKNEYLVYDPSGMLLKIIFENSLKEEFLSQPSSPILRTLPKSL